MTTRRDSFTRGKQAGFTLLELIISLFIASLIGLGATTATSLVLNQGISNSDYTAAGKETQNAIYWIGRDVQMSQRIEPGGATGFPLTLRWTEWDNSEHEIIYSITDGALRRSYEIDGVQQPEIVIAQHVNSSGGNTGCDFANGVLNLKVTATVGDGSRLVSVAKERTITSRPGL